MAEPLQESNEEHNPYPNQTPNQNHCQNRNGNQNQNRLCRRCKSLYDPEANSSLSCRFHPSFFVSRRHDDQQRYYELKPDDPPYAAKFYDCCGAEDPVIPGCCTSFHVSYDDP